MNVLFLADRRFATRERSLLSTLEVGLADEGARVIRAVPSEVLASAEGSLACTQIGYAAGGLRLTRRLRAGWVVASLAEAVPALEPGRSEKPDLVIHAMGESSWNLAREVGALCSAPVALEVWRAGLVDRAASVARSWSASARSRLTGTPPPLTLLTPDEALHRALGSHVRGARVRVAPWGVHTPERARPAFDPRRSVSVIVLAETGDSAGLAEVIRALAGVAERFPSLLVFLDGDLPRMHPGWEVARAAGLLDRLSLIPNIEARRDLITQGDLLIVPEAAGAHHSLVLDCMASGMAVVARQDAMVDYLVDGRTAKLVRAGSAETWRDTLIAMIDDPAGSHALGMTARRFVQTERASADHVRAVLEAYRELLESALNPGAEEPTR